MKIWVYLGVLVCLGGLAASASAQKKRPAPRPAPTPVKQFVTADERAAKQTTSNQLANLSGYLQRFTPMVQPLSDLATADKAGKLSKKASTDYNNARKKLLLQLNDFGVGLTNLETDFKTKPALAKYLLKIQGISDLSATAEDSASSGRYDAVREALKGIVQRLSDTVAAMPS